MEDDQRSSRPQWCWNISAARVQKTSAANMVFFSCDEFDVGTGVMTAFLDEARLTDAMMKSSMAAILLADSSKIGKVGFAKICEIGAVNTIITDAGIPETYRKRFEEAGIRVIIAG